MKKSSIVLCAFLLAVAIAKAQAPGDTVKTDKSADPMVVRPAVPDDPMAVKPGKPHDDMAVMTDTEFISKNIGDNLREIQLAEMAKRRSTSVTVKKVAATLITDHTAILSDLKKLALKKQMKLSKSDLSAAATPPMTLPEGNSFDAAWASAMLTMHKKKIAELQKFISTTGDRETKAAASKALLKIKMHTSLLSKIPGANPTAPNTAMQ